MLTVGICVDPNDNVYCTSTNLSGPWSAWANFATVGSNTYNSQTAAVVGINGVVMYVSHLHFSTPPLMHSFTHSFIHSYITHNFVIYLYLSIIVSGNSLNFEYLEGNRVGDML